MTLAENNVPMVQLNLWDVLLISSAGIFTEEFSAQTLPLRPKPQGGKEKDEKGDENQRPVFFVR